MKKKEISGDAFKTLYTTKMSHGDDYMNYHEVIEFNNLKFRIIIELRNGSVRRYTHLQIMTADGAWSTVTDAAVLNLDTELFQYVRCEDEGYCKNTVAAVQREFRKYITAVYS